jgi:flagellar hook-associated protein 1 FlgK
MANFSALNTGLSALIAHRKAAETISHNISNVNTEGYSRRRVDLATEGIGAVAAVYSRGLNTGNGVKVDGITRIRDDFLETQYRNESATQSQIDGAATVANRIETAFPEPSDNGISEQLGAFWGSWDGVVNQPDSEAARQNVLSRAQALVQQIQTADKQVRTVHDDAAQHVSDVVAQANNYAQQIATLNDAIKAATVGGTEPNDLLDRRDQLADKLTSLVGGTVQTGDYNEMQIYVGGRAMVYGDQHEDLQAVQVTDSSLTPLGFKRVEVQWKIDNYPAQGVGGEASGYLTGANVIAPSYVSRLNDVAATLVSTVNALHTTGTDLDGNTGHNFFDPAGTTAQTLAISSDVAGKPRAVAAASAGQGQLDTGVAEALAGLKQSPTGADVAYRSMVTDLGTEVQYYQTQSDVQTSVVQRLDQDRKNVSGVNLDEEMVNLVAEQHAYSAAARVITTVDEMLDTLINHTGRVGL